MGRSRVKILRKAFCFPLFFVLTLNTLFGQAQMHRKIGELGIGLGGANYIGDLSPSFNAAFTRPAFNIFYRANFNNDHLVFRTNIAAGSLYANESELSDALQKQRGLQFSTTFIELGGILEYNFLDYRSDKEYQLGRTFSPFLFFGFTCLFPNSADSPIVPGIPYGVGIKYILSHHWNMGFEIGGRKTFTDDLDGYNNNEIQNTSRGNDHYLIANITFSYTFYSFDCPSTSPLLKK